MKKYLARRLRRAANRLDPQPTWSLPYMTGTASNSAVTITNVRFNPEAAGRRAVRKYGGALRLLGMK